MRESSEKGIYRYVKKYANLHEIGKIYPWYMEFNADGEVKKCIWSKPLIKMLGYENEQEFPNSISSIYELLNPNDKDVLVITKNNALKSKEGTSSCEFQLRVRNKGWQWFKAVVHVKKSKTGNYRFFGNLTNIHEYKIAELKLETITKEKSFQIDILTSLATSYLTMHVINLINDTVYEYGSTSDVRKWANERHNGRLQMQNVMKNVTVSADRDRILHFTDLSTIGERLKGKKSLSTEFVSLYDGWCRAVFIPMDLDKNGVPKSVIFATRVIEEEKQREEQLVHRSNTDELTQLYNRHAFEDTLKDLEKNGISENFLFVSMDVNGLKSINDNLGHAAGDELIVGAASCMEKVFGRYGKLYRIGGDEFVAICEVAQDILQKIQAEFDNVCRNWKGNLVNSVTVSCGYVSKADYPYVTLNEIVKIADQKMYKAKNFYYIESGMERRGSKSEFKMLLRVCQKVLKVDLKNNVCFWVKIDDEDKIDLEKMDISYTDWLQTYKTEDLLVSDDVENFYAKTDVNYLKKKFDEGSKNQIVVYKEKSGNFINQMVLEIIPVDEFSLDNQIVHLYLKKVE